jgi:hypothetical protein
LSEPRQKTRPEEPPAWEEQAAGQGPPPPPPPPPRPGGFDLSALFVLVDALRSALPAQTQAHFTELLRELLLTLRSLIDWYLERLDRAPREPKVEEIRIE